MVHALRAHVGNNPRVVGLAPGDGVKLRIPPCERYQVVFDTANILDTCTLQYDYTGGNTNVFLTLTGPSISPIMVYPGPDCFLRLVGLVQNRCLILTSGNQE